ncbi:hypothetical protein ACJDT4_11970 [Clostridium neuense]|uniref:HTH cro/C1-type domain-containing protein n=1 Tax=Clostridium neuense TaxID=1728934 RepID=A0ABW8TFC4_9CLOT
MKLAKELKNTMECDYLDKEGGLRNLLTILNRDYKFSDNQLALITKMDCNYIYKLRTGKLKDAYPQIIKKISHNLNINVELLLSNSDYYHKMKHTCRVIFGSYGQFEYIGEFGEGEQLWRDNKCGFCFIRKAKYFRLNNSGNFCKACNVISSNKSCEVDFLNSIKGLTTKFSNVYFVVQSTHPELRSQQVGPGKKSKKLIIDMEVYIKVQRNFIPIIAIETNENNHTSYFVNQDNLYDNYKRKRKFFNNLKVTFLEIPYVRDKESVPLTNFRPEVLENIISKKLKIYGVNA